jgi:hypothetical protein
MINSIFSNKIFWIFNAFINVIWKKKKKNLLLNKFSFVFTIII